MSLKKYEAFVRTVDLGSLTKAAKSLSSTQSRISHILGELEQEYGFQLLKRSRGGIMLTDEGRRVLPRMREILKQEEELQKLVQSIRSADEGTIRLGAFTSVAVHWLPGIIRVFEQAHPQVELQMYNGDYHDMELWLKNKEIDVGFVALPAPQDVNIIPLAQDPLVAVLPQNHRLAEKESIPLEELETEPFISLLESSAQDIYRALDQAGIHPNIRFTTKDDYAILAMVEQGLGISIVPRLLLEGSRRNLAVRPLDPRTSRTIALAIPRELDRPLLQHFAETAVTWVQDHDY